LIKTVRSIGQLWEAFVLRSQVSTTTSDLTLLAINKFFQSRPSYKAKLSCILNIFYLLVISKIYQREYLNVKRVKGFHAGCAVSKTWININLFYPLKPRHCH
jgi:hypothetical protein